MIQLTRGDGKKIVLNAELIQYVESTPDTVITLTTNQRLIVKETADEVVKKVMEYKKAISYKPLTNQ